MSDVYGILYSLFFCLEVGLYFINCMIIILLIWVCLKWDIKYLNLCIKSYNCGMFMFCCRIGINVYLSICYMYVFVLDVFFKLLDYMEKDLVEFFLYYI